MAIMDTNFRGNHIPLTDQKCKEIENIKVYPSSPSPIMQIGGIRIKGICSLSAHFITNPDYNMLFSIRKHHKKQKHH